MMLMFVNDNREYCDVGFLKDVPHHEPKLLITKMPRGGAPEKLLELFRPDFNDRLWLDVNKPEPRVRIYRSAAADPFVRTETAGNVGDFRWALNLEGHEVYNRELKRTTAFDKLVPRLRINDGMFYAQTPLSRNGLTRTRPGEPLTPLGKVAVQLRAEIGLDAGQFASFFNGTEKLPLPATTDIDYGIYVCNSRPHGHEDNSIDAENYHPMVVRDLAPSRRILFGREGARSTPDSSCLVGWMGMTEWP
jgi:hypothetical protein